MNLKNIGKQFERIVISSVTGVTKWLKKWHEERKNKKIYKRIVTKAIITQSNYVASTVSTAMINLIIVALQLISFFTTFEGAKYYLAEIAPIAPLLFALSIQGGIITFAVSLEKSNLNRSRKGILLLLFTTISIVFSYTGMCISSFSPIENYNNTYKNFSTQFDIAKAELIEENSSTEKVEQEINDFYGKVDNLVSIYDGILTGYDQKILAVQNVQSNSPSETTRYYNEYRGRNETVTKPSEAFLEASRELPNIQSQRSEFENAKTMLVTAKGNAPKEDVLKFAYGDDTAIDAQYVTTLVSAYNSAASKMGKEIIDNMYIINLRKTYANFEQIDNLTLEEPEGLNNANIVSKPLDEDNLIEKIFKGFFVDQSSASEARICLRETQNCIDEAYNEILLWNTGNMISNLKELERLNKEIHNYGDPNLQAFVYLVDKNTLNKCLGILALAVTIDGLTLLISILGKKKPLALLAASTEKELITNEEDLFIMVSKALSSSEPFRQKAGCDFEKQCLDYVKTIKEKTRKFISEFNISPWTNEIGYGQYASLDTLQEKEEYKLLMTLLQQLNYLKIISYEDFKILKYHYNGIQCQNVDLTHNESDICLLRYRANNFMIQNCTDNSLECYLSMFNTKEGK